MALVNINEGLKEEYSMNKTFSAEYDFSCVRQTARADRFARVLTCARAIARVKRKGLHVFLSEPDDGNISPSELSRKVDGINDIDAEHQDKTADLKPTISSDSSVENNSQQAEREFNGARPKVKQQVWF